MKTEKGIFEVEINNGEKVKVYQMKINGERWYSVFDSPYAYDTKQEIKECKYLNQSKITKTL